MHEKLKDDFIRRQNILAEHYENLQYLRDSAYRSTEILNRLQKILPPKSIIRALYANYYNKDVWSADYISLSIYAHTVWGKTPKDLAPYLGKLERLLGECKSRTNDDASELMFEFSRELPMRVEPRKLRVLLNFIWQKPEDSTCQIVVTGYTTRHETQYVKRQVPTYQIVCP